MSDWKILSSETVYESPWIKIKRDEVLNQRGTPLTYSYLMMVHIPVTVVAVNDKGEILLQKNYRYTLDKTLWEVPSGHSDGQEPLEAAKRELLEEAGLVSDEWSSLGEIYLACGIANICQQLFLATNVRIMTSQRDEDEDITEQQFMSREAVKNMLANGEIVDGDSAVALYRYILQSGKGDNEDV